MFSAAESIRNLMSKSVYDRGYDLANLTALSRIPTSRDRNQFYWKPERPDKPEAVVALECQQWRHQIEEENYDFIVRTDPNIGEYQGALELRIEAANMTESVEKRVNLKIRIIKSSTIDEAKTLIRHLTNNT